MAAEKITLEHVGRCALAYHDDRKAMMVAKRARAVKVKEYADEIGEEFTYSDPDFIEFTKAEQDTYHKAMVKQFNTRRVLNSMIRRYRKQEAVNGRKISN